MKKRVLYWIFVILGILGALVSLTQFIMAICYLELGRVLVYLVVTVLFTELAVLSFLKLRKRTET